jgi:hypothetical protein
VVILLVLLVVLRLVLWLGLPWFLDRTLRAYDLTGSYEKLYLSLLTGDMELQHLTITGAGMEEPVMDLEYCKADISLWTLLRGRLVIPRIEVDGLDVTVHRRADGSWTGWEGLNGIFDSRPPRSPKPPKVKDPNQPLRFNLQPPLRLDALRLQHVQIAYTDDMVSPPLETRLDLNLRLSDLGSKWRRTRFSMSIDTQGIVDKFVLEGSARGNERKLEGSFSGQLQGARTESVQHYLKASKLGFYSQRLDGGLKGSFRLAVTEDANDVPGAQCLSIQAQLEGLRVAADTAAELAMGQLALDVALSRARGFELRSLQAADGRVRVYRDAEGGISLAGIYLLKPKHMRQPKSPKRVAAAPARPAPPDSVPTPAGLPWSVGEMDLKNVELVWDEDRIADVPPIALTIENGTIGPIEKTAQGIQPIPMQARAHVAGIVETGTLSGRCDFMSPTKYVEVVGDLQGITPATLGGYLAKAKLESEHHAARLRARVRWSMHRPAPGEALRNSAVLRDLTLEDQGKVLAALDELAVEDIAWNKKIRRFSIDRIAVRGDQTTIHWDPNGEPHMWGFGLASPSSTPAPVVEANVPPAAEPIGPEPAQAAQAPAEPKNRAELFFPQITWDVGDITLIDESDPNEKTRVRTASLVGTVENLTLNARQTEGMSNGRVDIRMAIPGLVEALTVTGSLTAEPPATRFDLAVDGSGLALREMQMYLKPLGVVPHMDTSTLHLNLDGRVVPLASGVNLSLDLEDCTLADADQTYFRLGQVKIEEFQARSGRFEARVVEVNEPMVAIRRDPNGLRIVSGISFIPRPPRPKTDRDPLELVFDRIAVHGARLAFLDQRLEPALEAELGFDVLVQDVNTLTWDTPVRVEAHYQLPGVMDQGSLQAAVTWSPKSMALEGKYTVTGLHPRLVARYLPKGSTALVREGCLAIEGKASVIRDPNGGKRWDAQIRDLDYREVNEPSPWLHLDEIKVAMQTVDDSAQHWAVDEILLAGVEARTERGADGRFHTLGFALGKDPNSDPVPSDPGVVDADTMDDPNTPEPAVVADVSAPAPLEKMKLRDVLPDIVLHRVHLGIRKLSFQDFGKPAEPTVALEDMVLANKDTIELLGEDAASRPPAKLDIQGRLTPWVESLSIQTELAPFAAPSSLVLDVNLLGVKGTPIMAWFPALAERIDASDLTDGRLQGTLEASATVARRHVTGFDFRKPFGATVALRNVRLTQGADQLLNGLDAAHIEIPQIDLRRQRYAIRSIELLRPQCHLVQEPNGLRVFNLVVKQKTPPTVTEVPPAAARSAGAATRSTLETPPAYRLTLDQLLISGLDFEYRDTTVTPPTYLPLNGLDLDLRGLELPVPAQASPVRFNTIMTAGRVPISNHDGSITERYLMQELTASGHLTPGKSPAGWIKMGIRGFEIRALRGMADRKGIQIREGVMDLGVDVRVQPSRTARTTVKLALSDLSVRDSTDGVIQQVLLLPVSLDVAIHMLQDLDGSLRVNIPFTLDLDTLSPGQLNAAVIGATAAVLGKAIATSPVKLVTGTSKLVTETGRLLTGQTQPKEAPAPVEYEPLELVFEPGAVVLNQALQVQVDILAKRLRKNRHLSITVRHQFGIGDLILADRLANPSAEDNDELLHQLRSLKHQMSRQRVDLASRTRAAYAAGDLLAGSQRSYELGELDNKLGMLEVALDKFLERLGPGSAYIARSRARDASLSLARVRLSALRDALRKAGIKDIENRLQLTQPSYVTPEDNQPGRVTIEFTERR